MLTAMCHVCEHLNLIENMRAYEDEEGVLAKVACEGCVPEGKESWPVYVIETNPNGGRRAHEL